MTINGEFWCEGECVCDDVTLEEVPPVGATVYYRAETYKVGAQAWKFQYSGFSTCTKVTSVVLDLCKFTQ